MSDRWRVLVVEDDENLNRSIVSALRRDGYFVQGVASGAEAIRTLWSEEYHVVICDLKTPGPDGFELLQWIRAYRSNTRVIVVAAPGSRITRAQVLESGAASYLEKPLDLQVLREELRSLLYQTGFSADLDSFDLLDVIQMVTMSRKTIALVVNTGLEERGILRFQGGELVWAEYGVLQGEEAFFALAAYKNGTVIQQPLNGQITPNVRQPLSRLILQALQYREKFAARQQLSGEQEAVGISTAPLLQENEPIDDRPFLFVEDQQPAEIHNGHVEQEVEESQEWWQQSGRPSRLHKAADMHPVTGVPKSFPIGTNGRSTPSGSHGATITPSTVRKTPASERTDLPSWLIDQPTQFEMPALRPSSLSNNSSYMPVMPAAPAPPAAPTYTSSPAEWQPPATPTSLVEQSPGKRTVEPQKIQDSALWKPVSPEWPASENGKQQSSPAGSLQSLRSARKSSGTLPSSVRSQGGQISPAAQQSSTREEAINGASVSQPISKRNYPALVGTLQTLGYSVQGFVATAIVGGDGQPIAQVAIDEHDITSMCPFFGSMLQSTYRFLDQDNGGRLEETVITSSTYYILLRIMSGNAGAFHVLVTTREADLQESRAVMANVEGALGAYL